MDYFEVSYWSITR